MTPTEQDKELRELQEFIKSCFGMEPEEDWYDYYRYDDRVRIRDFITADRKRVALEARLDEAERILGHDIFGTMQRLERTNDAINRRIAELKAQSEKAMEEKK